MLDYVGVPFDPACLEFHRTKRAVHTPSAEQVRRPINREGAGRLAQLRAMARPTRETLGEALENWER